MILCFAASLSKSLGTVNFALQDRQSAVEADFAHSWGGRVKTWVPVNKNWPTVLQKAIKKARTIQKSLKPHLNSVDIAAKQ
ncbi:MAG: hypothetical protein ACRD3T_19285 [Terriglobia bacterium]